MDINQVPREPTIQRAPPPKTQSEYVAKARILNHPIVHGGNQATLGALLATEISKPIMQAVMEKRLAEMKSKGFKGEATINYEARYMSSMLAWACNFIPNVGINTNPLLRLQKIQEPQNERYVTDREYNIQMNFASGYLPAYFELSYLLASRKCEVRELRESDLLEEGVRVRRRKGSKENIVEWTPRLRAAIRMAKAARPLLKVVSLNEDPTVLMDRKGQKITNEGINSAMSRLKKKMVEAREKEVFWSLHTLKHRGQTDAEDKRLSGHKHEQMKARYDHSVETVKSAK